MSIYFAIVIMMAVSLLLYRGKYKLRLYWLNCIVLLVIVGLRNVSVGNDTENYVAQVLGLIEHPDVKAVIERIWVLFITLFQKISSNPSLFLALTAVLELVPLFIFIRKESENEMMSLVLFVILNTGLCFYMTGIRQSIAVALVLFAFLFFKEKKYIFSVLFVLLGAGFHATALFAYLFIPLAMLRWKKGFAISLITISALAGFLLRINIFSAYSEIAQLFTALSFYSGYSTYEIMKVPNLFGLLTIIVPSTIIAICAILDDVDDIYTKLFICGVALVNFFASTPTIERYFMYLTMLQMVMVPSLYRKGNVYVRLCLIFSILFLVINFFKSVPLSTGTDNYMTFIR